VPPLAEPAWPGLPADRPSVAVFRPSSSTTARESEGWLRYLLEQVWALPYASVTAGDIEGGALADVDVLLVPNGNAEVASNALGQRGRRALADWVAAGGRFVGWRGGAEVAARVGITSAQLAAPKSDVAGALLRVRTTAGSPLAAGVGPFAWVFYDYDLVMRPSSPVALMRGAAPASTCSISNSTPRMPGCFCRIDISNCPWPPATSTSVPMPLKS